MASDFKVIVGLDVDSSFSEIKNTLLDLQKELNKAKDARLKLIGTLDTDAIKSQLATLINSKDTPKINIGVNASETVSKLKDTTTKAVQEANKAAIVTPKVDTSNIDKMSSTFMQHFDIVKQSSEEVKTSFHNAFAELFTAKSNNNTTAYENALRNIINLTKEFTRSFRDDVAVQALNDYKVQFEGIGQISKNLKPELEYIFGSGKELTKVLNSAFGKAPKGGWFSAFADTDVQFMNTMKQDMHEVDALVQHIETLITLKEKARTPINGFDIGKFNESDIESFINRIIRLDEVQTNASVSAKEFIETQNKQQKTNIDTSNIVDATNLLDLFKNKWKELVGKSVSKDIFNNFKKSATAAFNPEIINGFTAAINKASNGNDLRNLVALANGVSDAMQKGTGSVDLTQRALQKLSEMFGITVQATDKLETETVQSSAQEVKAIGNVTDAIEKEIDAANRLKAIKNSTTYDSNGQQLGRTSVYGSNGYSQTSRYDENDNLTSYTQTENFQKMRQEIAKAEVEATKLQTSLDKVKSTYKDVDTGKPIKIENSEHIEKLNEQYEKVKQSIDKVRTADSETLGQMKANANAEIETLKQMRLSFERAAYAANQLRKKDISTTKNIETQNIDNFVAKITKTKVPMSAFETDIQNLRTAIANVTDSKSLTDFLNQFDIVKAKFSSMSTLYSSIEKQSKALDTMTSKWEKQGIYVGNLKTVVDGLKASLSQVTTVEGLTAWTESFNTQMSQIDTVTSKTAIYQQELRTIKEEWKEQGILTGEIAKKASSLGRTIASIKKPETLGEWVSDFEKLKTLALQTSNNIQNQITAQKQVYELQTKLSKLDPVKNANEYTDVSARLANARQTLENYQMQGATLKNIISLEQQEQIVLRATATERQKLTDAQNKATDKGVQNNTKQLEKYRSEIIDTVKELNKLTGNNQLNKSSNNPQVQQLKADIQSLISDYQRLMSTIQTTNPADSAGMANLSAELNTLKSRFDVASKSAKDLQTTLKQTQGTENLTAKIKVLQNQLVAYKNANSKAMNSSKLSSNNITFAQEIDTMLAKLKQGVDPAMYQQIANNFRIIKSEVKALGLEGSGFIGQLWANMKKFASWMGMTTIMTRAAMEVRRLFTTVIDLDTALIDLKKTFKGTNAELNQFYYDSNKLAKELGVTTKEIIEQASAWSRLGFSTAEASANMAKYSAIFKNISPGMDADLATDGLVSMMKAFDIGLVDTEEVLDGIISKVNEVGNTAALNNEDIVEAMTRSSSALAAANNTLEESIALNVAGIEITRDAASTATAWKTVSMRIRGKILPPYKEIYMLCS